MASGSTRNVTFSVSVVEKRVKDTNFKVKNAIRQFTSDQTWFDVFDITTESIDIPQSILDSFEKSTQILVSATQNGTDVFDANPYDAISVLTNFDPSLKYVTITYKSQDETADKSTTLRPTENAYDLMMGAALTKKKAPTMPLDKARFSDKDRLYNDLVDRLNVVFPSSLGETDMTRQMMVIADTIWYIDGNHDKINSKTSTKVPKRFSMFTGYNDFKKKRKATPQLTSKDLDRHADLLFRLTTLRYAHAWGEDVKDLHELAITLQAYSSYLNKSNVQQKYRQSSNHPIRTLNEHSTVQAIPKCNGPIKACYSKLDQVISEADENNPVYFDETIHLNDLNEPFRDKHERRRYFEDLSLSQDIDVLYYDPGAGLGRVIFLWRVPDNRTLTEAMTACAKIHKSLENRLPVCHTRAMRRDFVQSYQRLADIQPHVLRTIYTDLTLDATAPQNQVELRLRQAIISNDPDMAIDLRTLNKGRPGDTYNVFFECLEKEVSEVTATCERRHNTVQHFSKYISVRDLIEQTSAKCPEGTQIPSESTVLFAFVPKNSYVNIAKLFKGRINLQHKVQTRQLRSAHIDEHYCAAIFCYLRRYAVKYRDLTTFVAMDDKSKVDFGEPGMALSTGVRGKKSIVPIATVLGALDHDVSSKGSLTPSVCLEIDVPADNSESFYRGQVHVTLKDSVLQPSSPFRHAVELKNMLKPSSDVVTNPILLLFTDGGPDHRTTYAAVKLSLIILFKYLDLDILIAARTAPGHSWLNPAERIMSLLNLGYQNVSLYRSEMNSHFEQVLKSCNGMNDIRKKSEKEEGLEEAWLKSVQPMVDLLNERTARIQLKGKNFLCGTPQSRQAVKDFEHKVKELVDPDITLGKYTKNDLKNLEGYKQYIDRHCQERHYIFQVRKCDEENCCAPIRNPSGEVPPFLPDPQINVDDRDHFMPFEEVIGKVTTECDMPSGQTTSIAKVAEAQQGCPNRILTAQHVRCTVTCYECGKPRCIYAKKALSVREERGLRRLLEKFTYSCGSIITPDGDSLQGLVFVRLQLSCTSPLELPYYSAANVMKEICCYCASTDHVERDQEALRTFRVVLPMCSSCQLAGKSVIKRLPKKQ